MPRYCATHRIPRAHHDPIDDELTAMSLISLAISRPLRDETVVVSLDRRRCGLGLLVVSGTESGDALFDVLDLISAHADRHDHLGGMIVATVRPDGGAEPADVDRWLEASAIVHDRGLELVEWFVVGDAVVCPRDLLGERPRWGRC